MFMKESMDVYDGFGHKLNYGVLELLRVPYQFTKKRYRPDVLPSSDEVKPEVGSTLTAVKQDEPSLNYIHGESPVGSTTSNYLTNRSNTVAFYEGDYVRVCITMPSIFGFRSWRSYEAIIEALAVGISLYATFVLTSTLFFNAERAIVYSTVMTVCLSAVRILTTLF